MVWDVLSALRGRKAYGVDVTQPPEQLVDRKSKYYILTPLEATLRAVMPGVDVPYTNVSTGVRGFECLFHLSNVWPERQGHSAWQHSCNHSMLTCPAPYLCAHRKQVDFDAFDVGHVDPDDFLGSIVCARPSRD